MFFLMVKIVFLKINTWMQIVIQILFLVALFAKIHSFETSES